MLPRADRERLRSITKEEFERLPDSQRRLIVRELTDIEIPEEAIDISPLATYDRVRRVGSIKKLIPDQRYNLWRHPTYTEIEDGQYVHERAFSWRLPDGSRWVAKYDVVY
jgi:hypothetical protein